MTWKTTTNDLVRKATGYQLVRADDGTGKAPASRSANGRHLVQPVFIISSVRSGSTLLKSMMGAHSQLWAPHELHLRGVKVDLSDDYVERSMTALGYDAKELEHIMWDCMLSRELQRAGKPTLVNKTPQDVFMWRRITKIWPDVRFVYLQRHPVAILKSWRSARKRYTEEEAIDSVLSYTTPMETARSEWPGHVVHYEDLTTDPVKELTAICGFLGIPFEPGMLNYRDEDDTLYRGGYGDWSAKIKSGTIHPPEPLPDPSEVPPRLKEITEAWGYV